MKKRKIIASTLAMCVATSCLAACGGSSTTAKVSGAETDNTKTGVAEMPSGDGRTVINVWTEDRHDLEYVEKMIEKYNEENTDNIEIKQTVITEDYANMLALAYNGGTAPDITGFAYSTPLNQFADTGIVIPLNEFIDNDEEYRMVNEPYEHRYEGLNARGENIYAVFNGMRSGVRVQYNKNLLEESGYTDIPASLEEYIEMAKKITEDGGGSYFGIGFTSSSPFERLLEMSAQMSGIYYYDYKNGSFDFSGYKPILEKGREIVEYAYPDQQGVDNMRALFTQQSFALWSNASQEAGVFTKQLPITDFEWGVGEVPTLDGEVKGALQTNPAKAYAIVSSTKNKEAAWKVIKYFQSEEFLKGYLENGYCLPISNYMDERIDKSKIGRLADFSKKGYEDVYPLPPLVNLQGEDYRTVLWNAVMGYVDIDDAIEDLNTRYNEALEADIASASTKRLVISNYDPLHPSSGTAEWLDK